MKALGEYSLASFIKFIISAAWYIQLFFLLLLTVGLSIKFFYNDTAEAIPQTLEVVLSPGRSESIRVEAAAQGITDAKLMLGVGKLTFNHQGSKQIIAFVMISMWIGFAISLSITYLLRNFFRSLSQNSPFAIENARRLRLIAVLIMLTPLVDFINDMIVTWFVQRNFMLDGADISAHVDFDLKAVFAGLVLLIIAEIFRIGAQMKEEQELTV